MTTKISARSTSPIIAINLGLCPKSLSYFAGTVAENIRYGRPEATDGEIETFARKIGDGDWLETLPDGLNSEVGERGNRFVNGGNVNWWRLLASSCKIRVSLFSMKRLPALIPSLNRKFNKRLI